ncbi:MAG: transglutaminase domain-containing protein [Clostridia bacterium]|nr:transglutaminase domain-containing protein [Clostridia bacterium]
MKNRLIIYTLFLIICVFIFAGCSSATTVTVEAGDVSAEDICGIADSSFGDGFDTSLFKTVGQHNVTLTVEGKSQKYRVTVIDTTAPVIEVGEIRINVGDGIAWKKQATVTDNSNGKIDIKVDSTAVNTSVAGTYSVTYTATDESGNSSSATATVIVGTMEVTEDMLYAEIDKVIAQIITDSMTTEDKVRAVYAYVQKSINYSATAETDDFVYAAYMSLFSSGTGDCYSYFAASKAFFERLGIENVNMKRADGGAPGNHYWNLVNIGTKDAPKWYHYDANPINGQYAATGCLLTDAQVAAYDAWCGQGYRKYDKSGIPASATETITDIPELRG